MYDTHIDKAIIFFSIFINLFIHWKKLIIATTKAYFNKFTNKKIKKILFNLYFNK